MYLAITSYMYICYFMPDVTPFLSETEHISSYQVFYQTSFLAPKVAVKNDQVATLRFSEKENRVST